jgi:uncharacterized damage-inducible protein DinB
MSKTNDTHTQLISQLKKFLIGGHAHATFEQAVKGAKFEHLGKTPHGLPYSIWQLVEHIRVTQYDILDFSRNPDYKGMNWPDDYWPKEKAPASEKEWHESIKQVFAERDEFISMLEKQNVDLYTPFPWGDGQNLLREALLIIDHTAYHTGEIIVLRRLLGDWKN